MPSPRVSRTPSAQMSNCCRSYAWTLDRSGDGGASSAKVQEARTMVKLAMDNDAKYLAFEESWSRVVLELDSETACKVERLMNMEEA